MSLDALNYSGISPQAFSQGARIDSYACRTGMGNRPDYPIEEGIQFFLQTNESLAQLPAERAASREQRYFMGSRNLIRGVTARCGQRRRANDPGERSCRYRPHPRVGGAEMNLKSNLD